MGSIGRYVLEELTNTIGEGNYHIPLYLDSPIQIGAAMYDQFERERKLISAFYDILVSIARTALDNGDETVNNILFSEPVVGMTQDFHRRLPDVCWKKPVFLRTDQSISGKIYELQAPGSGWGDITLIAKALKRNGCEIPDSALNFTDTYSQNIIEVTQKEQPRVFHMLDAASEPPGLRYLFSQTRPKLLYWGIDKDVYMHKVDYVTAHSAAALVTSNYFSIYMDMAKAGEVVFGISPNLLFDQKAMYVLPFYRGTCNLFSDEIRTIFPFTSFIENGGFYDETGNFVSVDDLARREKRKRRYFLKYGGTDLTRNWGSREVYRLDTFGQDECRAKLQEVSQLSQRGEIWLIQEDASRNVTSMPNDLQSITSNKNKKHVKLSVFYGSNAALGVKVMARKHFKVHGQKDTYVGIGV